MLSVEVPSSSHTSKVISTSQSESTLQDERAHNSVTLSILTEKTDSSLISPD